MLSTLPTRKNSTHQARFILCEVSHTRSAETPQPSSSRFRTAITIPPNVAIASPSIHQQTTKKNKLGRGQAELHASPHSGPERAPANVAIASPSIHQQTTNRTSWEGGKRNYKLLLTADPSAPPLTSQSHHLHQQTTNRTSWEGGKRNYTLLPTPDPSAPPLTSQLHHLQLISKLQIEQVGKGASGTTRFSPQRTRARPRSIQLMPDKL